jgi:hypothetical protein
LFPFENYLQTVKKQIRKPEKTLEQIINRYREKSLCQVENDTNITSSTANITVLKPHSRGPILHDISVSQFAKILMNIATFKVKYISNKDCYFISSQKEVVEIHNIITTADGKYAILGYNFETDDWYNKPLKSSLLSVFKLGQLSTILKLWPITSVKKK